MPPTNILRLVRTAPLVRGRAALTSTSLPSMLCLPTCRRTLVEVAGFQDGWHGGRYTAAVAA
jgi:hypothetical protein